MPFGKLQFNIEPPWKFAAASETICKGAWAQKSKRKCQAHLFIQSAFIEVLLQKNSKNLNVHTHLCNDVSVFCYIQNVVSKAPLFKLC